MDTKKQTRDTYDTSAEAIAKKFNDTGARGRDVAQAFSYIKNKNPKVLEIGCGNGRDVKEILNYTKDYIGMDYSKGLLEIAKRDVPEAKFELADIETYEFPKNLDVIFSFASLLHTDKKQVAKVLNKSYEALNAGGIIYLSLKYGEYREETTTDAWGTRTFYFYTPESIEELSDHKFKTLFKYSYEPRGRAGDVWFEMVLQK